MTESLRLGRASRDHFFTPSSHLATSLCLIQPPDRLTDNTSDKGKTSSVDAEGKKLHSGAAGSCPAVSCLAAVKSLPLDGVWEEIRPWCCEFPSALAILQQHT